MSIYLRIILAVAIVGLLWATAAHLAMIVGIDLAAAGTWLLAGLFVAGLLVAFSTIGAIQRAGRGKDDDDFWRKVVLPACPPWMRTAFYALLGYSVLWLVLGVAMILWTDVDADRPMGLIFSAAFMALYAGYAMVLYFRLYTPAGRGEGTRGDETESGQ
jgi:hypothetical protein